MHILRAWSSRLFAGNQVGVGLTQSSSLLKVGKCMIVTRLNMDLKTSMASFLAESLTNKNGVANQILILLAYSLTTVPFDWWNNFIVVLGSYEM